MKSRLLLLVDRIRDVVAESETTAYVPDLPQDPRVRTYRPRGLKGRPPAWSGLSLPITVGDDHDHLDHLDHPDRLGVSGQGGQGPPYLLFVEEEIHEILRVDLREVRLES